MNALPLLSPHDAIARWGEYKDLLERVIADDRLNSMTLEYAEKAVIAGKLHVLYDGQTLITFYIEGEVCHLIHGAGELETIKATMPAVEDAARRAGVWIIRIAGRTGWVRVLSGYTIVTTILEKRL